MTTNITLEPIVLFLINRIAVKQALQEYEKWSQFTSKDDQDWPPLLEQVASLSAPSSQIVHDALGVYYRQLLAQARPYSAHRGLTEFIDQPR